MNDAALDRLEGRLAWIFGSPRSGSTWLARLLAAHPDVCTIGEPHIGIHLAPFAPALLHNEPILYPDMQADRPDYFFNDRYREIWGPPMRELILRRLAEEADEGKRAVVKEPHGSQAAETILWLLPRSFLIFLLRDGRDVVDSEVAALEPDAWLGSTFEVQVPRIKLVENSARTWLLRTEIVERAYRAHDAARRVLVRYEDLLEDTAGSLATIHEALGLEPDPVGTAAAVESLAFDRVGDRGPTKFHRRASPGGWRENLTDSERELMDDLLGPKLRELGYASG